MTGGSASHCSASHNTATGWELESALVTHSVSRENDSHGALLQRSTLRACQFSGNAGDGARVQDQNLVSQCVFQDNGGNTGETAGVRVLGNRNRIDDNTFSRINSDQDYAVLIETRINEQDSSLSTGIKNSVTRNVAGGFSQNFSGNNQHNHFPIAQTPAEAENSVANVDLDAVITP
jgi:hypothetical protein